jgi:hypothetical protein
MEANRDRLVKRNPWWHPMSALTGHGAPAHRERSCREGSTTAGGRGYHPRRMTLDEYREIVAKSVPDDWNTITTRTQR